MASSLYFHESKMENSVENIMAVFFLQTAFFDLVCFILNVITSHLFHHYYFLASLHCGREKLLATCNLFLHRIGQGAAAAR